MKIYTTISVLILVTIAGVVLYVTSPAASQYRGEASLHEFLNDAKITSQVAQCTPDTDGDGYASCTYGYINDLKSIQCTSSIMSYVPVLGSKSCKMQAQDVVKLR